MPIDPNQVAWDAPAASPAIDPNAVQWDEPKGQGGGTVENLGAGLMRGVRDVIDKPAQWLAGGFDKIAGTDEGGRVQAMNDAGRAEFDRGYGAST
ncbi:MAG: hypothetical protein QM586_04955, partial [Xenophilus sp.]